MFMSFFFPAFLAIKSIKSKKNLTSQLSLDFLPRLSIPPRIAKNKFNIPASEIDTSPLTSD